ncbi:MAG TPA: peptidoglycan-binding protein [Candidatus Paceibacterota bacterium]|nr:peptidoglycan-binding protein [Candidatus Paceibacterota bacterium]
MIKKTCMFALAAMALSLISATGASAQSSSWQPISRELQIGSNGPDVAVLQSFLEAKGYVVIPGNVIRGTYGALTHGGVMKFQQASGITPSNGRFGPATKAMYNSLVGGGTTGTPTPVNPGAGVCPPGFYPTVYSGMSVCYKSVSGTGNTTNNGNSNNTGDLEGNEASLENFEVSEGDDDEPGQGDSDAEVMEVSFDVEDGDVRIERVDFDFVFSGGDNADDEPWDVFETARVLVGGEEVADMDASDEDEWSEEDDDVYRLRFSGVDTIVREGETAEIILALDIAEDVEGSDDGDAVWEISVPDKGIRAFDAEGVNQQIGDSEEEITIDIAEDGDNDDDDDNDNSDDDELSIDDSSASVSTSVNVYEDTVSGWYTLFAFEIETGDNDIELTELPITIEFLDEGSFDDVIDDIKIQIDGDEYDDFDIEDEDDEVAVVTFDLDGDVELEGDETYTAYVMVKFAEVDGNYDDGDEIVIFMDEDNVDNIVAEGDEELDADQLDGEAESDDIELNVIE